MPNKYRSEALEALHKTAHGLRRAGLIDGKTMRDFDASCLTAVKELLARQIAAVRKRAGVSQPVFASYLNVTTGLVSQWERGEKHPQGPRLSCWRWLTKRDWTRSLKSHQLFTAS